MAKVFNVNGACRPQKHYMVDLESRLKAIKKMVDDGEYFTVNRARQFGKTTTLNALAAYLKKDYQVISLDFQTIDALAFESSENFVAAFAEEILDAIDEFPDGIEEKLTAFVEGTARINSLQALFKVIKSWCGKLEREPVLIIDEVDTATNNQVFIDFLAQLRAYYLKRPETATFQSVILAGVYDVRNIKRKLRPERPSNAKRSLHDGRDLPSPGGILALRAGYPSTDREGAIPQEEHKSNSPWNIAAKFRVDMSFAAGEIGDMLKEYEADYQTGMDIEEMSKLLYDYTSGYPVMVSTLCKYIDEEIAGSERFPGKKEAWTKEGFLEAVKILTNEPNPLFLSMKRKVEDYPSLRTVLYEVLFAGKPIPYVAMNDSIEIATMFGFVRNENGKAVIFNRIFETVLYDWFMSEEYGTSKLYDAGLIEKNQFVTGGHLNVRRILERFVESFDDLYGDRDETFLEDVGRRYFMLFLKPIINGVGNCYVEAETRNRERTDLVIDYLGEQFVIELKLWRGNAYNERGEAQLLEYLDHYHLKKGYMLSFNFNQKKEIGVKEITLGDKVLIEAVV
ncbi:MAG: AAA-like domain-containing protein [Lachnospiraceae bacterium]|nr:AAA-like domain-containing protein [Lachnospiraceae bacterium]